MSDNRTEEKKKTNLFTGLGRFFKTVGDVFSKNGEKSDYESSIPVDISPDIQEIPPVINEYKAEINELENEGGTPFGDSLKKILATLSATEAKQKFMDFIRKKEVDRLTPFELETLDSAYHRAINLATEKRKQYASLTGSRDMKEIKQLLKDLKADNTTPPFVKQEIIKEVLKGLKENPSLMNNYTIFLKRLEWEINGEKRIIDYTVKTLNKANDIKERFARLNDLAPYIQARIKDKKLKDVSRKLFDYMIDFYDQLNQRLVNLGNETELDDELGLDFDDDNLPDFGAEDIAFLKKLAQKDDPSDMALDIDRFPEEKKADIIQEIAFDPRFDRYFKDIVGFLNKEDLGKLIGMVIMRVKEIERTQGRNVSRAYITDLINRLTHKLGDEHIIVLKVKNIQHHLIKAYGESAVKLEELKRKIQGKNPYEQIQIIKDASEEPGSSALFGAIRNLERLTVETHFDEIFSGLPLETQKVVAEGLLSDLVALKNYYPHLISRLESKLDEVDQRLKNSTYSPGEVDHELIDRIVDYANKSGSPESGIPQDKKGKDRIPEEIKVIEKEIDSLPSLNAKITTARFWIENHYYSDKPVVEKFLLNKLEGLERAKAREGGLLRDLFDELRVLDTIKEKINFLEEKLKDPLYFHLKSMIKTLIGNIATNTDFAPVKITEDWILKQLRGIPDINRKIDWLRIRRYLASFEKFSDFINETIEQFETYQKEELQEELEEKIFGNMLLEKSAGKEKTIYKNIITLTRAALSLGEKVQRRKLIKEQEILYPLDKQDRFFKQRKLLYYLLNTQNDDVPVLKLKVLADKVLLSFNEKKDYLSLLKLSRFKGGDKVFTLMGELGLTDEDIAYYAVYILGSNRPGLEKRIEFIEDYRNGLVDVDGVPCPTKENRIVLKDYREFFVITPPVFVKVLTDLKKKLPEKREKPDSKNYLNEDVDQREENDGMSITEGEVITENKKGEDHTGISEIAEEEIIERTEAENTDSFDTQAEIEEEQSMEAGNESSLHNKSLKEQTKDFKVDGKNRKITFKTGREITTTEDDSSVSTLQTDNEVITSREENEEIEEKKEDESEKVYKKNKSVIDNLVQKRIIERGVLKSKSSAHTMLNNSEKATKEEEIPLSKRIARLLFDLSKCYPEAVPDIINRTIIPVFIENKSDAGRDIFNAINQNIFIPVLYNGAEVDVDSTVDSIESFLGKKGILSESHKIINSIVDELRNVRSKEIKAEVERKIHGMGGTSELVSKEPDKITQVLRYLLGIDDPKQILPALDEKYIYPLSGNTGQKDLLKKLHTLKSILNTSKSINWQKVGDYYGEQAIPLMKQIKQRIGILVTENRVSGVNTKTRTDSISTDEISANKIHTGNEQAGLEKKEKEQASSEEKVIVPKVIENTLIKAPIFTDPHTVILKMASKDAGLNKMFGGNRNVARQYVIDTLYNAGKIFSYDKKRYIGFGRLAHYLHDKGNKDYNRQALAQALLAFISRFPGNALKAAFIGVEEKDLTAFLQMLEAWIQPANPPVEKKRISDKKETFMKNQDKKNKTIGTQQNVEHKSAQPTNDDKTKQVITQKNQATTKKTIQYKTTPRIKDKRTYNRRKKKTYYPPEKERRKTDRRITDRKKTTKRHSEQKKSTSRKLSARGETMLKKAEKLITEKLILLIKLYNDRQSLKMLYNSYLSSSSDRKYRLNLIDQKKHSAIYNAIKDDDAVLERLRFDVNKVMKQYHKKLKKMKK